MTSPLDEAQVELVTVGYLRDLGYEYIHGPDLAPDGLPDGRAGEAPEAEAVVKEVA